MKKMPSFRMHSRGKKRKKGDTAQLAAQLAPLEEQEKHNAVPQSGNVPNSTDGPADRDHGAIVVDSDELKMPKDIMEVQDEKRLFGIEPVVLVVLIIVLSFIAFIAWQISLMPAR